jgi:tRNA(fMet)-specific endonuclease VapC
LDTNIIIDLLANEEVVRTMLGEAEEAFVPSIAMGELYYGAEKSTRPAENVSRIDEFAAITAVLENVDTHQRCKKQWVSTFPCPHA